MRIPAQFRFTSNEVYVRRDGKNSDVILSQSQGFCRHTDQGGA